MTATATHPGSPATIDDLRLYTKALSAAEVMALYQGSGLLPAGGPHPYAGENNVDLQPTLTWQPGNTNNFQYNVYLGTNAANVAAATTNCSGIPRPGRFGREFSRDERARDQHALFLARG